MFTNTLPMILLPVLNARLIRQSVRPDALAECVFEIYPVPLLPNG
jgi:hypothetical protein